LLPQAYQKHQDVSPDDNLTFEEWGSDMTISKPQFAYWSLVLECEVDMVQLIRSVQTGNFRLYIQVLLVSQFLPWFFALDHANYSHWLSVHVRDLKMLEKTHPGKFEEFWGMDLSQ
jgi:hypothetical protein